MVRKINPNLTELFDQKQQNLFCDVTLVASVDGSGMRAHRNVLYTASAYFKKLLTADMKEKGLDEIPLDGVSGAVLRQLIDYAYTQEINIDASNVDNILAAADRFMFDGVVEMCTQIYKQSIDETNALQILAIAEKYRLNDLEQGARTFALGHFLAIVKGEPFFDLEAANLIGLLGSDDIQVVTEEDIFNAIAKWIDFDPEERRTHYAALMKTVRMSKIDSKFLNSRILGWSRQMNMPSVFMDACAEKYSQDMEMTDDERTPLFKYMFVAGDAYGVVQIERYSSGTRTWKEVCQIDEMTSCQIHCLDDCLYLLADGDGDNKKVMCMPLSTMSLETCKSMNKGRRFFASVTIGQYVYCMGGVSDDTALQSVERYDSMTDEWVEIGMLNQGRFHVGAAVLAGQVFVVGGYDYESDGRYLRSVERYDSDTNRWTNVAELNVARGGHRCVTIGGSIYAVGGENQECLLASIEKYDEQLDQWMIVSHHKILIND